MNYRIKQLSVDEFIIEKEITYVKYYGFFGLKTKNESVWEKCDKYGNTSTIYRRVDIPNRVEIYSNLLQAMDALEEIKKYPKYYY